MADQVLCIVPTVPVWKQGESLVFDRKFFDGMEEYVNYWGGPVSAVMRLSPEPLPDFGTVVREAQDLPFRCVVLAADEPFQASHLEGASIVLAGGDAPNQLGLVPLARQAAAKIAFIIEYIPETRYQIAALSTTNPVVRLRRFFYIWNQERVRRGAFAQADGLQSNGTPAAQQYAKHPDNLVYFDTRVRRDQYLSDAALEARLSTLEAGGPLRLAFSGRLVKMKGADHLVVLAGLLRDRQVDFQMTLYGTGDLDGELRRQVETLGLQDRVFLPGSVDFNTVLLPEVGRNVDLFVILHRQSDPSCTYLETLACGVPLVGYANRALQGLLETAEVGWGRPLDDVAGVAEQIAHLDRNRGEIAQMARSGLAFARKHDFETTMKNRVAHLRGLLGS